MKVQAEGCDDSSVTFILHDKDHTLGNSLRYMIMTNPEIEFGGYSITHPSESKINFRIQTREMEPSMAEAGVPVATAKPGYNRVCVREQIGTIMKLLA